MTLAFSKLKSNAATRVRKGFHRSCYPPFVLLICLNLVPLMAQGVPEPVSFSLWATNIANLTEVTFLSADFDNDGKMDLLLHGRTNNQVTFQRSLVLTNRGDGSFGLFSSQPGSEASFSAGDWSNDGKLDLLRVAGGSSAISIQTNNSFQDHMAIPTRPVARTAWIDFDSDGDLDGFIVGGAFGPSRMDVWEQESMGVFQSLFRERILPLASDIVKGDFNADGRMDWILLPPGKTNQLLLCLNSGDARWTERPILLPEPAYFAGSIAFDADNDGLTDVLLMEIEPNALLFLRNQGGSFAASDRGLPQTRFASAAAGDVNHDGFTDLLLIVSAAYNSGESGIYLSDHGTNFIKAELRLGFGGEASFADFNQDGSLDLLVHGRFDIYTNGAAPPRLPSAPINAAAISRSPQEAQFNWAAPDDGAGFTYNIRIGTTPGGVEVVSPHSDVNTGLRRIVELGNAGPGRVYQVGPLPPGTYYWSVQSINQAFAGSAFTEEQVFAHTTVPLFQNLLATNVTLSSATLSVELNPGGLPAEYFFEYGPTADQMLKTPLRPLARSTEYLQLTEELPGLQERTSYLFRIVAQNSLGTNQQFGTFATGQFLARTFHTSVTNSFSILKMGDLDGDDKMDFVGRNQDGLGVTLFWNSGTGFEPIATLWTNVTEAELLDWDNDGRLDVVALEQDSTAAGFFHRLRIALNRGAKTFIEAPSGLPDSFEMGGFPPQTGDFDRDGLMDVILGGNYRSTPGLFLFWGSSNGFVPTPERLAEETTSCLTGDFNNDGYPDLLAGSLSPVPNYKLFLNAGGEVFHLAQSLNSEFGIELARVIDFDQDGRLDGSFHGPAGSPITWFLGNLATQESWRPIVLDRERIFTASLGWGDYDLDGRPDFLVAGRMTGVTPTFPIVVGQKNLGNNQFVRMTWDLPPLPSPFPVADWFDWERDGDLDVLILLTSTNSILLLENRMNGVPLPPPPRNLASIVSGSGVRLQWDSAEGTGEHALTHNVRVGTAPGKWDVINPHTIPGTGKLLLHKMGNAELRKFSILKNLPAGDYFWSVQSVDWAYRGSEFAAEQQFTIEPEQTPLELRLVYEDGWNMWVSGQRGREFVLEMSRDLKNWQPESTNSLVRWKSIFPISVVNDQQSAFFRIRTER
jgi:hypothetical protein